MPNQSQFQGKLKFLSEDTIVIILISKIIDPYLLKTDKLHKLKRLEVKSSSLYVNI